MIKRVAIFSSFKDDITIHCLTKLSDTLKSRGVEVFLLKTLENGHKGWNTKGEKVLDSMKDIPLPDLVFSVGGDGTFLETSHKVVDYNLPIAGINTGRLGFLANISLGEIEFAVDAIIDRKFSLIRRYILEVGNPEPLFGPEGSIGLNEVTVQKADLNMITIRVRVDGIYLNTYWADGLIVSTATGSTAYNVSTGGPILSPTDKSIVISAISPHNLTVRPVVLPGNSVLELSIDGRGKEFLATCDFRFKKVAVGTNITIRQSAKQVLTVMLDDRDFFSTLRSKLMWGADTRN